MRYGLIQGIMILALVGCSHDKPQRVVKYAADNINTAQFSSHAKHAIIGSLNHEMGFWDTAKPSLLYSWRHKKSQDPSIVDVAVSSNGRYTLTADKKRLVLWDTQTGKTEHYWEIPHRILAVDLGPNGNYAIAGLANGEAWLFDAKQGNVKYRFIHNLKVSAVALSNDGKFVITGSDDKTASLWNIATGHKQQSWRLKNKVTFVALSPKSRYALTAHGYGAAQLWRTDNGQLYQTLGSRPKTLSSARFSPSERFLAVGIMPQRVTLWHLPTKSRHQSWLLPKESYWRPTATVIHAIGFSEDEKKLKTIDSTGSGYSWAIKSL